MWESHIAINALYMVTWLRYVVAWWFRGRKMTRARDRGDLHNIRANVLYSRATRPAQRRSLLRETCWKPNLEQVSVADTSRCCRLCRLRVHFDSWSPRHEQQYLAAALSIVGRCGLLITPRCCSVINASCLTKYLVSFNGSKNKYVKNCIESFI